MNFRKILIALIFILVGITIVSFFWKQQIILSFLLIALGLLKHKIAPIKHEARWFITISVLGASTESLMIWFGNYPWIYAEPQIGNIPFWLPSLWGLAGTIFITLHEGFINSK